MRSRIPACIIMMLVPLLGACADHLVAPGTPQPNRQIAEVLARAPQTGPVAVAQVFDGEVTEYYLARGKMLNRDPNASFRMDWPVSDLTFTIVPGGGRAMLNTPNTRQVTWSFYCYNFSTDRWVQLMSVRVNDARQIAQENTGGHQSRHNLATKPVGTWAPRNSSGAFVTTWTSTITSGIASGDELIEFPATVNDEGGCKGDVEFYALSATRWPGLELLTGFTFDVISSNHSSVYYATPQMAQHARAAHNFYRQAAGASFTVTAAALVYGGINDVNFNWRAPHSTHRIGTDLDIDGSADNQRVWDRLIAAGRRGGFARCEVHNQNHVHCYDILYPR